MTFSKSDQSFILIVRFDQLVNVLFCKPLNPRLQIKHYKNVFIPHRLVTRTCLNSYHLTRWKYHVEWNVIKTNSINVGVNRNTNVKIYENRSFKLDSLTAYYFDEHCNWNWISIYHIWYRLKSKRLMHLSQTCVNNTKHQELFQLRNMQRDHMYWYWYPRNARMILNMTMSRQDQCLFQSKIWISLEA